MKTTEAELHRNWWTVTAIVMSQDADGSRGRKFIRARCNHCRHVVFERLDRHLKRKECPSCGQ